MRRLLPGGSLLCFLFLTGSNGPARADEEEQIQAKLQAVQRQLKELWQQEKSLEDQQKALVDQLEQARTKRTGEIKAEVRGVLRFENGKGAYLSVKSKGNFAGRETRVWLRYSEDKVTGRLLDGLMGKEVVAKGLLEQMPEDVNASTPPLGMYLTNLRVEEA